MIYIHIPFCISKCLYCDFYSALDSSLYKKYTDAVISEMAEFSGKTVETVYIGGGTPTILGADLIRITDAVREHFIFKDDYEFTVETNPRTADFALLKELRMRGVNRISMGAQSFNENELKLLGRAHNVRDIYITADAIEKAGFQNFNIDLMFAIPSQTVKSFNHSIDCALSLSPKHISAYSLIIEENTPFYSMNLDLPDEDTEREMYYLLTERLEKAGLNRYEISNYAYKGYESRHNIHYWQDYEYIGIGAAAHSYYNKTRYNNCCDIKKYISGQSVRENITQISDKERSLELFMLGLRMKDGVLYNGEFEERVVPLIKKGLLEINGERLRLTKRGTDVANLVFMEFLND